MKDPIQVYHWGTSYDPLEMKGHRLDWANQPSVYKRIEGLPSVPLSQVRPVAADLDSDVAVCDPVTQHSPKASLEALSHILFYGYGITARRSYPAGVYEYRSVPSAGALYPCELYAACRGVAGLPDGLYHYEIATRRLVRLRNGDMTLPPGAFDSGMPMHPVMTFYVTAVFYRSVWKYRDRAYRYHLLDSGHLVESLVMAVQHVGFSAAITYDFDDGQTNAMLGVDPAREACLAVVSVKANADIPPADRSNRWDPVPQAATASRVSEREEISEAIREIHASSSRRHRSEGEGRLQPIWDLFDDEDRRIPVPDLNVPNRLHWEKAVLSRRSNRNFIPRTMSYASFSSVMRSLVSFPEDKCFPHRYVFCSVLHAGCDGVEPGLYGFEPEELTLVPIQSGKMVERMADIALYQRWLALAGMYITFVAPLSELHTLWGPRGYRYAMLSAGRLAHRVYLEATAIGLGCCGIGAFFDRRAAALLRLPPQCALLYFVAVGPIRGRG